jgi:hypothetical protein
VYFHGGVSFNPYLDQYKKILPKKKFKYYEIYNASEGFFAIQDQNNSSELLLMLDYGIFYEFIPMHIYATSEEKAIPLSEVKLNTSLSPYRIKISGRTKHHINVFGEELIIENAENALKKVCKRTKSEIVDYTAAPIFMAGKEKGAHEWLIEFKTPPKDINYFNELFDNALKALNSDYEAKRYNNITLNKPKIHMARKNLFHDWLKKNDKLGGQHKVPRLSNTRDYMDDLLSLNVF